MPVALFALALCAFVMGTAEFVITGLLPEVTADLGISVPVAGLLLSGYALAVVVGGPLFTAAGTRAPRRALLLGALALFVLGNVLTAVAPGYGLLMTGRVLAAFGQSAFLGIAAVVAAGLVPADRRSRAIATVFTGFTVANVVGAPLGTALGQSVGWRLTFVVIAAVALACLVAVAALVGPQPRSAPTSLRHELAVFADRQVWLVLAVATLAIGGMLAAFGYVAPLATEVAGLSPSWLMVLLALFGVGMVVGNLLGGRYADRAALPTLCWATAGLTVMLLAIALVARQPVLLAGAVLLLGAAGFATVPCFMVRLLDRAGPESLLASAAGVSATNLGIAVGTSLGGAVIARGLGYTAPSLVGAVMAVLGLGAALLLLRLDRRSRRARPGAAVGTAGRSATTIGTGDPS